MIPAQFDYVAPTTVAEALTALAEAGDEGKVLAGGQSLLPILRMRLNSPEKVIDLGRIAELREITDDGDSIVIGAMATHDAVLRDQSVAQHAALLTRTKVGLAIAVIILGQMAVRLRGRLAGLPDAGLVSTQMTARATGFGLLQAASAICRHYWPVALLAALVSPRFRTLVIEVALAEGVISWMRHVIDEPAVRPPLGPLTFLLMKRLDDLAYGAGLWQGVMAHRDLGALRPVLTK